MCTITQQWYETLLLRIGIPNENHDDTEQISDTINVVDGYRLCTNDVVRATCIRGVRTTAVFVSYYLDQRSPCYCCTWYVSSLIPGTEYFDRWYYCDNTAR